MLILCCGNPDRGDDIAGVLVAKHLTELGIEPEICAGEAAELLQKWEGSPDVVVVDAAITGALPGTIHLWDVSERSLPPQRSASTHGLGVAAAVKLARTLGTLPTRLRVFGIEVEHFELGTEASQAVRQASKELASKIAVEVTACQRLS